MKSGDSLTYVVPLVGTRLEKRLHYIQITIFNPFSKNARGLALFGVPYWSFGYGYVLLDAPHRLYNSAFKNFHVFFFRFTVMNTLVQTYLKSQHISSHKIEKKNHF